MHPKKPHPDLTPKCFYGGVRFFGEGPLWARGLRPLRDTLKQGPPTHHFGCSRPVAVSWEALRRHVLKQSQSVEHTSHSSACLGSPKLDPSGSWPHHGAPGPGSWHHASKCQIRRWQANKAGLRMVDMWATLSSTFFGAKAQLVPAFGGAEPPPGPSLPRNRASLSSQKGPEEPSTIHHPSTIHPPSTSHPPRWPPSPHIASSPQAAKVGS